MTEIQSRIRSIHLIDASRRCVGQEISVNDHCTAWIVQVNPVIGQVRSVIGQVGSVTGQVGSVPDRVTSIMREVGAPSGVRWRSAPLAAQAPGREDQRAISHPSDTAMDRFARILLLHRQFMSHRFGRTTEALMALARCSRATLTRDLVLLRDGLGAPLVNDGKRPCTWRYAPSEAAGFQLPGVWLGPDDLYALLMLQQLFERSGANLLGEALARLWPQLKRWLGDKVQHLGRIRVQHTRARRCDPVVFRNVAEGLLERRQLSFHYTARSTEQSGQRLVSPQRLFHHGDTWYLDAWDPGKTDLRRFSVDRIRDPAIQREPAFDLSLEQIAARLDRTYGAITGFAQYRAILRFSAHAARWVANEEWHPDQTLRYLPDGRLEMELPYAHSRELQMDLLRYGADVEVVGPAPLRRQMRAALRSALDIYAEDPE